MKWKLAWKIAAGILAAVILFTAVQLIQLYHNRSSAVYQRIINQDGYSLSLVKEGVAVEFFLKPEWIPKEIGETKLNLVVAKKFDSDIVLEKVSKREKDLYIQLNVVPHPNPKSGQILNIALITKDSFINTNGPEWIITDATGKDVLGGTYGGGEGPGNAISIDIPDTQLAKFAQGVHVRFSGFYLYGYTKLDQSIISIWLSALIPLLVIACLIMLYRRRSEPEKNLGWKLIGHMLLGGFTFTLNGLRLPLGFVVYLLFFRKPRPNLSVKDKAALLGLAMYVLQIVTPPVVHHFDSAPKQNILHHVSVEQLGVDGLLKMVIARAPVSNQARIESFETVLDENGEVKELVFQFVDSVANGRYTHISAVYHASEQSITLKRSISDGWLKFPQTVLADNFINRVQELELLKLKPAGGDHRYVKLELDPLFASYAMKNESNFGVNEKGVYPIGDNQLPVTATRLIVCAPQSLDRMSVCEDQINYYFNIVEGGALE
ncbi:hypothetical protein [Paenibacillus sp. ATY16]|uniref:hypothetical protein n=1 Tax=Paenibacillus sp. ATY16 TaxID=1759312 RepID=UPI00200FDA90|nr:hypothetical protein [Paenibacillus sp. ATY16]MCK9859934.1 hypothetical protein [Paenibacillus sp. ATY16]